jgi:hypothetical protein
MPSDRGCPHGGEGGTSCRRPFPGRPGLSQSCSRRIFHSAALRHHCPGVSRIDIWYLGPKGSAQKKTIEVMNSALGSNPFPPSPSSAP